MRLVKLDLEDAIRILADSFPKIAKWKNDDFRELSSPWVSAEWNQLRMQVFLSAMKLHRAFVFANRKHFLKNLSVAMDILSGQAKVLTNEAAVKNAWASLFFVVPVVSTTFASVSRLFSGLGKEAIGLLLIDEAGQATPQSAIGAIFRSKQVVVVGDPLQLEPVVTLPSTAQTALLTKHHVSDTWLPSKTSVQSIADRASKFGTSISRNGDELWVGAPLRVHRRCLSPMFEISNKIAYSGLMVYGTPPRPSLLVKPSCWIDVKPGIVDGNWIPDEGVEADRLISYLQANGIPHDEIFLISPFREVVRNLWHLGKKYQGITTGTIHTAQGKESMVTILVLGGNPNSAGARSWASRKPNLLNVAASRAKDRLYIIGNMDLWAAQPYFNQCANLISRPVDMAVL